MLKSKLQAKLNRKTGVTFSPFDVVDHLRTEKARNAYLKISSEDGQIKEIADAIRQITRSRNSSGNKQER